MLVQKAFRYQLKLNRSQKAKCVQFAGACRWIYNRALQERKEAYEKEGKMPSLYEQNNELPRLKKEEETSWLKDVHSQVLQQALCDLDRGYQHAFRRLKAGEAAGFPRFRSKGKKDSFRYPQGVKVEANCAYLPKIGWVRFRKSRDLTGPILQTTVIREANRWYISFSCEMEVHPPIPEFSQDRCIGIDLGLEFFATLSTGDTIANPRWLKQELSHLRYLSRQLSKKERKSKNWLKSLAKLRAFHKRVRDKRADFLHKLSTQLVKSHDLIGVESLCVRSMLTEAVSHLARAIGDAGWRQFLQMLKYKCEHLGKKLVEVGQFFPSSQLCSSCGSRQKMELQTRIYACPCGLSLHRDHNSALNLRAAGMAVLKARGAAPSGSDEAGILRL
jgi:putative transposase